MAQTKAGSEVVAAKRIGVSVGEYRLRVAAGLKWCFACKRWIQVSLFWRDVTRYDKLAASCVECSKSKAKAKYTPTPRVSKRGERFAEVRCGDKKQARARVNHLIKLGVMPSPSSVHCVDCGHIGDDRRHEYDHHEGYAQDKQEIVEVVCTKCHGVRSRQRGELVQVRDSQGKFKTKGGSQHG